MSLADILSLRLHSSDQGTETAHVLRKVKIELLLNQKNYIPYPLFSKLAHKPELYRGENFDRVRFRALFYPSFLRLGSEIASRYFSRGDTIVELESNVPDLKMKKTYPLSLLPNGVMATPSNPLPEIVKESQAIDPEFIELNPIKIDDTDADHFIASHLLDRYPFERWPELISSIMEALPVGGTFVHIHEILPIERIMAWDLFKEDTIVFPYYSDPDHFEGAIVIPDYSKNRARIIKGLHADEKDLLDHFARLSKEDKEQAFFNIKDKNDAFKISEWIKGSLPKDTYRFVYVTEHFRDKLKALSIPKAVTVFNGVIEDRAVFDKNHIFNLKPSNYAENDQGNVTERVIFVIAPDKTMVVNKVAVFVIKRIK